MCTVGFDLPYVYCKANLQLVHRTEEKGVLCAKAEAVPASYSARLDV